MQSLAASSAEAGPSQDRPLGTMVTYGYPDIEFDDELSLAIEIGASLLEILPHWGRLLDPTMAREQAGDRGLLIHSAHGCWGGRTRMSSSPCSLLSPVTRARLQKADSMQGRLCRVSAYSSPAGTCAFPGGGGAG